MRCVALRARPPQILDEAQFLSDLGISIKKRMVCNAKGLRLRQPNQIPALEEVPPPMRVYRPSHMCAARHTTCRTTHGRRSSA